MEPTVTRPFTRPQDYYQLREFGQKFEATITFFKHHGPNLYQVLLPSLIPLLAGFTIMATSAYPAFSNPILRPEQAQEMFSSPALWIGLLLIMFSFLLMIAMIYAFIKRRMENPDPTQPITTAEVWAETRGHLLPLLGQGIVLYLMIVVAMLFLVLPGIYLAFVFVLFPALRVFEHTDLGQTLNRSFSLVRGKWWSTCGLVFVSLIIVTVVTSVIGAVLGGIAALFSMGSNDWSPALVTAQLVRTILTYLAYPFIYVVVAFQYFNLVERRDGVGLQWKAEQLGQQPSAAPTASADNTLFRPSYGDQSL